MILITATVIIPASTGSNPCGINPCGINPWLAVIRLIVPPSKGSGRWFWDVVYFSRCLTPKNILHGCERTRDLSLGSLIPSTSNHDYTFVSQPCPFAWLWLGRPRRPTSNDVRATFVRLPSFVVACRRSSACDSHPLEPSRSRPEDNPGSPGLVGPGSGFKGKGTIHHQRFQTSAEICRINESIQSSWITAEKDEMDRKIHWIVARILNNNETWECWLNNKTYLSDEVRLPKLWPPCPAAANPRMSWVPMEKHDK